MIMAALWVPRLVLIALTVNCSLSFVLRRRDWDDDADNSLAQALPVLRAERRRLEERPQEGERSPFWGEHDLRDEEGSDEPLDLSPRLRGQNEEDNEDDIDEEENILGPLLENVDPVYMQEVLDDDLLAEEDENDTYDVEKPADIKDIEDILEPSEEEKENSFIQKRNIPFQLGGPAGKPDKRMSEEEEDDFNRFLENKVEEIEQEALYNEANEEEEEEENDITPLPVSEEDIAQILEDDKEEKEAEENKAEEEDKKQQEEILPPFNYAPIVPLKIKRSSSSERGGGIVKEGQLAREYIRRFLELEDDENTNLANALNLATMAQVEHSDKLIVPGAKFIKKAIEDEEAIQELKESLDDGVEEPAQAAEAIGKREQELSPNQLEQKAAADRKARKEEMSNAVEEVDEEDEGLEEEDELASRLRTYLEHAGSDLGMDVVQNEIPQVPVDRDVEWFNPEEDEEEEEEEGEEGEQEDWELNPLLRELYQRYRSKGNYEKRGESDNFIPSEEDEDFEEEEEEEEDEPSMVQINTLENEVEAALEQVIRRRQEAALEEEAEAMEEAEEEEAEGGICPALEFVDGCSYAVEHLGLKLDAEALDLCNRHQLCYTCGAAHGMTSSACDNGYIQEANQLCENDDDSDSCSTDAAGLFVVMLESHEYKARNTPTVCQNRCTMDFIVGLDSKK